MKTTYERGTDPRNMTRSTLIRHLRKHLVETPESTTLKRRVFDDWTTGWKVHWTNSHYFDTYVSWENGSTPSDRNRPDDERTKMRDAALTEIEKTLRGLGYVTKREPGCVLVLRRMGENTAEKETTR